MTHLTFTGASAGVLLCGAPRENNEVAHAVYAPLTQEAFRATCCPKCLTIFALHAYDADDEEMPDYIKGLRDDWFNYGQYDVGVHTEQG